MIKKEIKYIIPGNENYYISQENQIIGFEDINPIKTRNSKVNIPLYGIVYVLDLDWLILYCRFNVRLPKGYTNNITNLKFKPYSLESHNVSYNYLVLFKEPVYYKDNTDYRLLAMYPGMAVNELGDIVDIETGKYSFNTKVKAYKTITLYDATQNRYKTVLRHRVIALAWVDNDDYIANPIVGHKDGDKQHCYANNLEWVSFTENNRRTAEQGLRLDNLDVKIKDYKDNKVVIFGSMSQACKFMGRSRINRLEEFCYAPKLVNKRYQIKLLSDKSPWDFDEVKTIKVDFGDNIKTYHTLKELMIDLFPDITPRQNRNYVVKKLKSEYPNAKIYFPEGNNKVKSKIYQAFNFTTKEIIEAESLRALSVKIELSKSTVTKALNLGEETEVSGYGVREKTSVVWKEITKHVSKKNSAILFKNLEDGTSISFDSIRKASKFLNVNRKLITASIKTHRPVKGYLISKK